MNAFDQGYQNKLNFVADQQAQAQTRQINDYKLKRQPVIDQQADADRALALQDAATARAEAQSTAQRQAQLRGLMTLQTAIKKGKTPQEAVTALGRGGMQAFGKDLSGMLEFATTIAKDPAMIDAQIAGLSGKDGTRRVAKVDFAKDTTSGKEGMVITYDDGDQKFTDYAEMPKALARAGLKKDDAGNFIDPYTGEIVAPADYQGVFDKNAAEAAGDTAGKAGEDAMPWTPVQSANAKTTFDSLTLKNENLNTSIDRALSKVDWNSASLAQAFKSAGGPPADLAALLQEVGAQIGIDELTKLKQSGVTLGQVTEAEHALLQSMVAALTQAQSPQQLREQLQRVKQQSNKAWRITRDNLVAIAKVKGAGSVSQPDSAVVPDPQSAPTPKKSARYYD